ncbi:MAG: oligosaccharide flippase family protein [Oscillospiraceae bacterium]|jgi:stage V sporulation protein B|nr:oligosaccharide flippase family protein [Oscillospiraceae bacterium]
MNTAKKLVLNTILLTAAAFAMQTVSVSFNVYLTNRIGELGIGLFQLTMTVYGMAATFACAGVRLGTTRLNADLLSLKPDANLKNPMRVCFLYALTLGVGMGVILFAAAPLAAKLWLHEPRTATALRWLACGLPAVSLTAAMSGYFTAVRTVYKSALNQGLEQAVRIIAVIFFLGRMLPKGTDYACLAIVCGMVTAEVFALCTGFVLFRTSKHMNGKTDAPKASLSDLLHIAGPDGSGACARSILLTTEHLLIPRGFQASGRSSAEATRIYGVIHGMTLPVLLYPSAILSSLSALLVPEMAQLRVQNRKEDINAAVNRVVHMALLYGVFIGGLFFAFAEPLSQRIYGNTDAARYMQLLAPLVPVMYMDMSVDGMLKGLDQQKYSMRYNIMDSALCCVLVYLLLPRLAVKGYIIVLFTSEIFNFFLSIRRLLLVTEVPRPTLGTIAKTVLCTALAAVIPTGFFELANPGGMAEHTPVLAAAIVAAGILYGLTIYLSGTSDTLRKPATEAA